MCVTIRDYTMLQGASTVKYMGNICYGILKPSFYFVQTSKSSIKVLFKLASPPPPQAPFVVVLGIQM